MLRVNNIDMSPKRLLRNLAAPLPPPSNAKGSAEGSRVTGVGLIQQTMNQVNTSKVSGVGGKVDLLG